MNYIAYLVYIVCFLSSAVFCEEKLSEKQLKEKMLVDLEIIHNAFDVLYAPKEWKKQFANWDLDEEVRTIKNKIITFPAITVKDYQRLLRSLFGSCIDYHTKINFLSTEAAYLPFQVCGADRRYFISWVPKSEKLPFEVGDEVLLFDGTPIDDVIQELKSDLFGADTLTAQSLAEIALTMRKGSLGHDVPQGPVKITLRSSRTKSKSTYTMDWGYIPEEIQAGPISSSSCLFFPLQDPDDSDRSAFYDQFSMQTPYYEQLECCGSHQDFLAEEWNLKNEYIPNAIGHHTGFLPPLGEVVWTPDNSHFHSYLFKTDAHLIGFIRFSSYLADEEEIKALEEIIHFFEKEADALIIDQTNNPGGQALVMYKFASMLTNKPLKLYKHRFKITQQNIWEALQYKDKLKKAGKKTDSNAQDWLIQQLKKGSGKYFNFIIEQWNNGHTFTDPVFLLGIEKVLPNPEASFSKPLLILTNALSFSAADALAAIMQDNKRAKIFGTKTAGAGGFYYDIDHPNFFGIRGYQITTSFSTRLNGDPIENLGVTPDIPYTVTSKDLQTKHSDYAKAVLKAVEGML